MVLGDPAKGSFDAKGVATQGLRTTDLLLLVATGTSTHRHKCTNMTHKHTVLTHICMHTTHTHTHTHTTYMDICVWHHIHNVSKKENALWVNKMMSLHQIVNLHATPLTQSCTGGCQAPFTSYNLGLERSQGWSPLRIRDIPVSDSLITLSQLRHQKSSPGCEETHSQW